MQVIDRVLYSQSNLVCGTTHHSARATNDEHEEHHSVQCVGGVQAVRVCVGEVVGAC